MKSLLHYTPRIYLTTQICASYICVYIGAFEAALICSRSGVEGGVVCAGQRLNNHQRREASQSGEPLAQTLTAALIRHEGSQDARLCE